MQATVRMSALQYHTSTRTSAKHAFTFRRASSNHCRAPSGCVPWPCWVLRCAAVRGRASQHPPAHPHRRHVQLVSYLFPLQGSPPHPCPLKIADHFVLPCLSDQQQPYSGCLHTCTRQVCAGTFGILGARRLRTLSFVTNFCQVLAARSDLCGDIDPGLAMGVACGRGTGKSRYGECAAIALLWYRMLGLLAPPRNHITASR